MVITSDIRICQVVITSDIQKQLNFYFLYYMWCSFLMGDITILPILVSKQSKIYMQDTPNSMPDIFHDDLILRTHACELYMRFVLQQLHAVRKTKSWIKLSFYHIIACISVFIEEYIAVVEPSFFITWCTVGLFTTSCGRGKVQLGAHSKCF